MSHPAFLFIEVQSTGKVPARKDVRTAIQKHVMRDIGAARRGRPRQRLKQTGLPNQSRVLDALSSRALGEDTIGDRWRPVTSSTLACVIPPLVSGGARTNPLARYPIQMNSNTSFLIDYLYTSPALRLRPVKYTWLPLSLSDPALFYEVLSYISQDVTAANPECRNRGQALEYHALALQSVNKRLSDPLLGISNGIISTILAFLCFSHAAKDWKGYDMHMEGLLTIIRMKGGVHALDQNLILRLLLSGIDVSASCFNNTPPKFPLPLGAISDLRASSQELPWWLPVSDIGSDHVWELVFSSDTALSDTFRDLTTTMMTMKLEKHRRLWQDSTFIKDYIDPLSHRLLESSVAMDAINTSNSFHECSRLAALLLLSKIRRFGEDQRRIVFTGMETDKLRTLVERHYSSWTTFKPMLLWALVLGALEVNGEDRVWFCDLISRTAEDLDLAGWDDVVVHISNILWVGHVLDEECKALRQLVVIRTRS